MWFIMAQAMKGHGDKAWAYFDMVNPVSHARTDAECAQYMTEPYAVAADIYAGPVHGGRGGLTWYTGSSGWMYKVGLEHLFGIKKIGNHLEIDPCIPKGWKEFSVKYKYRNAVYHILVKNPKGINTGKVNVNDTNDCIIPLYEGNEAKEFLITATMLP